MISFFDNEIVGVRLGVTISILLLIFIVIGIGYWRVIDMRFSKVPKPNMNYAGKQRETFWQTAGSYWFLTSLGFLKYPTRSAEDTGVVKYASDKFELEIFGAWYRDEGGERWTRKTDGEDIPHPRYALEYFLDDYDAQAIAITQDLPASDTSMTQSMKFNSELIKRNPWVVTDDGWTYDDDFIRRYGIVMKDLRDGKISLDQFNVIGAGNLMKRVTLEQ